MDLTHERGSRLIDTIVAFPNVMECIEECQLLEVSKIINFNHRSYLVDINFEQYFDSQLSP